MRVKMLRNSVTPLRKGVVYNLPEQDARRLFGLGAAEKETDDAAAKGKPRRRSAKSTDDESQPAEQTASESVDE